ncbi:hypothetical protein DUNSADRAFT_15213, partial [Dunaliella salina]
MHIQERKVRRASRHELLRCLHGADAEGMARFLAAKARRSAAATDTGCFHASGSNQQGGGPANSWQQGGGATTSTTTTPHNIIFEKIKSPLGDSSWADHTHAPRGASAATAAEAKRHPSSRGSGQQRAGVGSRAGRSDAWRA